MPMLQIHGRPEGGVCIRNGRIMFPPWANRKNLTHKFYDQGVGKVFSINNAEADLDSVVNVREELVISWLTCEGNLNHMMDQTINPAAATVLNSNFSKGARPYLAFYGTEFAIWRDSKFLRRFPGCHGSRYMPLLTALPVQHAVFSVYSSEQSFWKHSIGPGNPASAFETNKTYCFHGFRFARVADFSRRDDLEDLLAARARCDKKTHRLPLPTAKPVDCLIIQRKQSRIIKNMDEVVAQAKDYCGVVRVVTLEDMSLDEQIVPFVCQKRTIVAGVHGAGMAWSMLVRRGFTIEWGFGKWGIPGYYKNPHHPAAYVFTQRQNTKVDGRGRHSDPAYPDKLDDLKIDIPTWSKNLETAVKALSLPE